MRLFSRSANASVGRFFEGATAMEQTCTSNSFRGSVPTEMILGVPSQDKRAAYDRGYGFRIEFTKDVRGPVAVGYGAHFGMGDLWMAIAGTRSMK